MKTISSDYFWYKNTKISIATPRPHFGNNNAQAATRRFRDNFCPFKHSLSKGLYVSLLLVICDIMELASIETRLRSAKYRYRVSCMHMSASIYVLFVHPTVIVGCNYLSLTEKPVSGILNLMKGLRIGTCEICHGTWGCALATTLHSPTVGTGFPTYKNPALFWSPQCEGRHYQSLKRNVWNDIKWMQRGHIFHDPSPGDEVWSTLISLQPI